MPDEAGAVSDPGPVEHLAWQKILFAQRLNAFEILKLGAQAPSTGPVLRVHRNHAFETVSNALPAFLSFAGITLVPRLGDYDDSLSFDGPGPGVASELVWLDFARYPSLTDHDLTAWLIGRLKALRGISAAPIIVANAPGRSAREAHINDALAAWAGETADAAILDLAALASDPSFPFIDEARAVVTGTRYNAAAALATARALAFRVLPRFFTAPIKAFAVDLDNTLYDGVLGEDGIAGIVLTPGHAALQARLAEWAEKGVLLAVISRNEPGDVEALFAARPDFPLKAAHISSWQVGWTDKSASVSAAAEAFRIAPDSILLIDDNLGELIEAAAQTAGLRLLFAGDGPADALRALENYPGLPRDAVGFEGRAADLRANKVRESLAHEASDSADYLAALGATLSFSLDPAKDRTRLAELSAKTNQFNLALRRLSEVEVDRFLSEDDRSVVHVRLADRLSDSGSVAALFARREGDSAVIEELAISCRALGRRLEDLIVGEALRRIVDVLGCTRVSFDYAEGQRNAPARRWLETYAGQSLPAAAGRIDLAEVPRRADVPVALAWTD